MRTMAIHYFWQRFVEVPLVVMSSKHAHCAPNMSNDENTAEANVHNLSFRQFEWIQHHAPAFPVDGKSITVLRSPSEFYETISKKIKNARERIAISSLYLGVGEKEKKLVDELQKALTRKVKVLVLLDYNRGMRGHPNSCTTLRPLLDTHSFHNPATIALYHPPHRRGFLRYILPEQWNELFGLQHMKLLVFDDSVLISGANLSHDYFTNRQDRYMLIENCKQLSEHMHKLISTVASFSLQLQRDGRCTKHHTWDIHPFEGDTEKFKTKARSRVLDAINTTCNISLPETDKDTLVIPFIQMAHLGIFQDEVFTKELLKRIKSPSRVVMSTGYFNPTNDYTNEILDNSSAKYSIITSSPKANGFYGARGIVGWVPYVYAIFAREFYNRITLGRHESRVSLLEFAKQSWTFHSKGLWLFAPEETTPSLTLIGSPNFGYRSIQRDLELQFAVVTHNPCLRHQLKQDQDDIMTRSTPITSTTLTSDDYRRPLIARIFVNLFRNIF